MSLLHLLCKNSTIFVFLQWHFTVDKVANVTPPHGGCLTAIPSMGLNRESYLTRNREMSYAGKWTNWVPYWDACCASLGVSTVCMHALHPIIHIAQPLLSGGLDWLLWFMYWHGVFSFRSLHCLCYMQLITRPDIRLWVRSSVCRRQSLFTVILQLLECTSNQITVW
jgi:hypothetical protein